MHSSFCGYASLHFEAEKSEETTTGNPDIMCVHKIKSTTCCLKYTIPTPLITTGTAEALSPVFVEDTFSKAQHSLCSHVACLDGRLRKIARLTPVFLRFCLSFCDLVHIQSDIEP